jgi:hypothetical protein
MMDDENSSGQEPRPTYRWPWWVLGGVLLAVVLAIAWMSHAIARTRFVRDLNSPPAQTNKVVPR